MRKRTSRLVGRFAGKLSLSIGRKMLLTALVSLSAVTILSLLQLELGRVVDREMGDSDRFRQIRDGLVVMRTAVLQSEIVVKDAIARRAEFSKANLSDLAMARKDFEREFKKAADFMREGAKALGNRDAAAEFAELGALLQQSIRPALKGDDQAALAAIASRYDAKAGELNEMLETLADMSMAEMRRHFTGTETEIDRAKWIKLPTQRGNACQIGVS